VTWRVEWPAEAVGGRVVKIPEDDDAIRETQVPNTGEWLPWTMLLTRETGRVERVSSLKRFEQLTKAHATYTDATAEFPAHQGAAVFVRPAIYGASLALKMKQQGIRTVAETDDLYFSNPNQNFFMRGQARDDKWGEIGMESHARSLASMGVNVFSTSRLRDRYFREYKDRFGKARAKTVEMHVCGNHMPRAAWPVLEDYDGPVRVGTMGSPSHLWDIHLAFAAFAAAKEHGARTVTIGYAPSDPDENVPDEVTVDGTTYRIRDEKSQKVKDAWGMVVDDVVRWVKPVDYHRAALPLDIGLSPLRLNDFNMGKSDVKNVEYVASGAVPVCMKVPPYTDTGWQHEVNCLFATGPDDMAYQVTRLIRDPKMRAELLEAGQEYVREQRNEVRLKEEWSYALAL
jgi:glycosyltransferase involved in cell wall biosynthesis